LVGVAPPGLHGFGNWDQDKAGQNDPSSAEANDQDEKHGAVHGGLISVAAVAAARQRALRLWFVGRSAQANGNQSLQQFRTAKPVSASWFSALSDTGAR
jgi:hypothetical protein